MNWSGHISAAAIFVSVASGQANAFLVKHKSLAQVINHITSHIILGTIMEHIIPTDPLAVCCIQDSCSPQASVAAGGRVSLELTAAGEAKAVWNFAVC